MSKRFYFEIAAIMLVSLLLLGFSFSKESGTNNKFARVESTIEDLRVIYGNGKYITSENNDHYYNIVNKSNKDVTYNIYINEINGNKDYEVSYILDEEEKKVENNFVTSITLKPYGTDGDRIGLHLVFNIDNPDLEFKLVFDDYKPNLFINHIINDKNVYKDSDGNYRYFGKVVNNYFKYDGSLYRIIGIVNNKLLVVGDEKDLVRFQGSDSNFVTVKDYLGSLEEHNLTIDEASGKTSWLVDDHDYWLKDKESDYYIYYADKVNGLGTMYYTKFLYNRFVEEIEGSFILESGDGTYSSPYEVSYESK